MANLSVKTGSNVFYIARSEASAHNDRLSSREGAADEMSIDRGRLFRIESGVAVPYPEEVLMMSDLYHKPELENYYCTSCCPLGHGMPVVTLENFDRITVEAMSLLRHMTEVQNRLLDLAMCGQVGLDKFDDLKYIINKLEAVGTVAEKLKLWQRKNLPGG